MYSFEKHLEVLLSIFDEASNMITNPQPPSSPHDNIIDQCPPPLLTTAVVGIVETSGYFPRPTQMLHWQSMHVVQSQRDQQQHRACGTSLTGSGAV